VSPLPRSEGTRGPSAGSDGDRIWAALGILSWGHRGQGPGHRGAIMFLRGPNVDLINSVVVCME